MHWSMEAYLEKVNLNSTPDNQDSDGQLQAHIVSLTFRLPEHPLTLSRDGFVCQGGAQSMFNTGLSGNTIHPFL